ncbi:uncharacterized protein V1516DRAFT_672520 [Lipomyces oligophaga]|uniref:uncharacterized protein n=1 Tax=Lipomyces oligophaga TaxID=45792 RepID=UPI0034CF69DC
MGYPTPLDPVVRVLNESTTTVSVPFSRVGLFEIGGRETVIGLDSTSVAVIAPVPFTNESEDVVAGREVKYLIAPDFEHHMALKSWKEKYPSSKVIGVQGLKERKKSDGVEVNYEISIANKCLTPTEAGIPDPLLDQAFQLIYLPAHTNKELILYHLPTKSLIEADLLFNLPAHEQYSNTKISNTGILSRIFNGAFNPSNHWHARAVSATLKDSPELRDALKSIYGWDFETIIPCHGDVITSDAKDIFHKVFTKFLQ